MWPEGHGYFAYVVPQPKRLEDLKQSKRDDQKKQMLHMYSVAHQVWVGCYLKREVLSVTIQNIANTDVLGQNP